MDLTELERQANDLLPPATYDYFAGGADDELTLQDNIESWSRLRLRPHVLGGIRQVQTETTLLGCSVSAPIMVAPLSYQRLAHPDGEVATSRGAAAAGCVMVVSTRATVSLENIAATAPEATRWFQVYILKDRGWTTELVTRAAAAGYGALVLTVDAPVLGRKRRDERHGFFLPGATHMANLPSKVLLEEGELERYVGAEHQPVLTFEDIAWLQDLVELPVVVKGVLRGDDAIGCVEAGAAGIAVSNHGGRQLDGALASADALGDVAQAVGGRAEIYVDGGIRRGTDIVKALAVGARAVMVGRPILWGLATAGEQGVRGVLNALRDELVRALVLCGIPSVERVPSDIVVPSDKERVR